jgi:hypothetical protein
MQRDFGNVVHIWTVISGQLWKRKSICGEELALLDALNQESFEQAITHLSGNMEK